MYLTNNDRRNNNNLYQMGSKIWWNMQKCIFKTTKIYWKNCMHCTQVYEWLKFTSSKMIFRTASKILKAMKCWEPVTSKKWKQYWSCAHTYSRKLPNHCSWVEHRFWLGSINSCRWIRKEMYFSSLKFSLLTRKKLTFVPFLTCSGE